MNFLGKKSIKKGFVGQLFSPKIRTRNLSYKTQKNDSINTLNFHAKNEFLEKERIWIFSAKNPDFDFAQKTFKEKLILG